MSTRFQEQLIETRIPNKKLKILYPTHLQEYNLKPSFQDMTVMSKKGNMRDKIQIYSPKNTAMHNFSLSVVFYYQQDKKTPIGKMKMITSY